MEVFRAWESKDFRFLEEISFVISTTSKCLVILDVVVANQNEP